MTESVNTGGLKEIRYPKSWKLRRDIETEEKIDRAYERYYKKRKIKRIVFGVILLIIISVAIYLLIKNKII